MELHEKLERLRNQELARILELQEAQGKILEALRGLGDSSR